MRVDLEPLERALDSLPDVLGSAVQAPLMLVRVDVEAELGRDDDLLADRGERFADELFVREWAVDLGRVEEGDAALDRRSDEGDHLLLVGRRPVSVAHAHAAEPDGRDFQVSKLSRSHSASVHDSILLA